MERDKLKLIVRNLKLLVDALESEVYSDVDAYKTSGNFDDPATITKFQITTKFLMTMTDTLTKLISVTPDAEKHMAYCARVSIQTTRRTKSSLVCLKYCVKHQHWSIFEQAYMTLEMNTTRGIAAQVLRHRSMTYQEFSQRYADSSLLAEEILYLNYAVKTPRIVRILLMILTRLSVQEFQIKMQSTLILL